LAKVHSKTFKIAVVGGETLLGHELKEVIEGRDFGATVATFSASGEGNFSEEEGEAVYIEALEGEAVRGDRAILLAGSKEGALKAYEIAKSAGGKPLLIDCTGLLEEQPEARLVAPLIEGPKTEGPKHDAAWLLAKYRPIEEAVVHVFEPASERGKQGLTELHQQTTGLLAFKPLEKKVFDAQLSFNLLAQYGEEAPSKLMDVEQKIERHLATILSRRTNGVALPIPSIRVIQAPIFHAYSLSLWLKFDGDIGAQEIGEALASAQIEVRGANEEPPNGVGAAGQSGLAAGDIRLDPNNSRAAWLWVVADNLRLMADGAAELVSALGDNSK
jgi:aspartate-semialdehyde dehydrogenase